MVKLKVWTVLLMSVYLTAWAAPGTAKYQTIMESVTAEKVNRIIQSEVIPSTGEDHDKVIHLVSSAFPATPCQAYMFIGGPEAEAFIANFNGADCFTLADDAGALTRNCFCTTLRGSASLETALTASVASTSSLTGSPPYRIMPGASYRFPALTMSFLEYM